MQDIVAAMDRGEVLQLMGDDCTPRCTLLGSQTVGHTGKQQVGAMYRIRSKRRESWSATVLLSESVV